MAGPQTLICTSQKTARPRRAPLIVSCIIQEQESEELSHILEYIVVLMGLRMWVRCILSPNPRVQVAGAHRSLEAPPAYGLSKWWRCREPRARVRIRSKPLLCTRKSIDDRK
jgi:hypothetical protein